ncbi:hypothetical protein [Coxiella endosymbiont of Ornithodoros amblus]|uniref:hypothetical protein n=1 Tax=Coxiella endosymbiont of Ornithodoros amblus TaxID=1656166 RepID=UPI00244DE958|nr:hypothetical protein [Coxiella endosymbiont of Ornithodoros amblus]
MSITPPLSLLSHFNVIDIVRNDNYFEILNPNRKMIDKRFQLLKTKLLIPDMLTQFDKIHNLTAFNAAIRDENKLLEEKAGSR